MKTRIIKEKYKIEEIRPQEEYNKYIQLIKDDIELIIKDNAGTYVKQCPACGSKESSFKFSKYGFVYRECSTCSTIYMTPRPTIEMLHNFYANSKGVKYWNSPHVQNTKSRIENVYKTRAKWIKESVEFTSNSSNSYLDYYPKYSPFIEEISNLKLFDKLVAYKPFESVLEAISNSKFEIRTLITDEKFSVISAFEVIDRFFNPKDALKTIYSLLEDDGLLFLSTTSASGFDIQYLLKNAKNIIPPINMTIFSIEGITKALTEIGFEVVEMSTPGTLDLQIIEKQIKDVQLPKFLKDIITNRDNSVKESFQEFLQRAKLSSYMTILAKKRK